MKRERARETHLSLADDEEGVSPRPLPDDVLSIFIVCLSGEGEEMGREEGRGEWGREEMGEG